MPIRQTTHFVDIPGGRLHARQAGSGPDLVLLNAGATDLRMWDADSEVLAAHCRVTRYDDRGIGRHSSPPDRPWSFTDDLLAVLDALGVHRPVLAGSSDGGRKALDFTVAHPDRVSGLILLGPALHLPAPDPAEQRLFDALLAALAPREAAVGRGDAEAAIQADLDVWAAAADPARRELVAGLYRDSPGFLTGWPHQPTPPGRPGIEHLADITVPTVVLVGEHDTDFTRACADRIAAGVPHAHREDVRGADHFLNLSRPEVFHRWAGELLASH